MGSSDRGHHQDAGQYKLGAQSHSLGNDKQGAIARERGKYAQAHAYTCTHAHAHTCTRAPEAVRADELLLAAKEREREARLDVAVAIDARRDTVHDALPDGGVARKPLDCGHRVVCERGQAVRVTLAVNVVGLQERREHREARLRAAPAHHMHACHARALRMCARADLRAAPER
jgi:hypothetical protein